MGSSLNLAAESAGRGRRPVGFGDDAAFDQSGGVHSTGLVVVDGPLGTTGIYGRYGGHLDSDGGVVDALHPAADGGGSNATTVLREGSTFTLPLSAAPGAGSYPLAGYTVDWGDGQASTPAASDTSASHPYTDGGRTNTAQANAVYGSGSNARSVPANPVAVQGVDVPAQVTSINTSTEADDGGSTVATVNVTAAFTDPGVGEHHQASITWGDNSPPSVSGPGGDGTVTVAESGGSGTITATHDYATSGTYHPMLQVTDDAGGTPGNGLATDTFSTTVAYVAPTFGLTVVRPNATGPVLAGGPPRGPAPQATAGAGATVEVTADGPNAGGVTGWDVDWGDGTPDAIVSGPGLSDGNGGYYWPVPSHAYAAAGDYLVTATPTDQAGQHTAAVGTTIAVAEPAPTNLTATPVDDEDVQLSWTPDPAAGTGYEVDRRNPDGSWAAIATVDDSTDGDTDIDSGLSGVQTYTYSVRAVGDTPDLNSTYTATASATTPLTTPDAPTGVSATESNLGEVDLTWAEDSTIVTGYVVTATPLGGGTPVTTTVGASEQAAAVTGLVPDVAYSFAVVADNDQGGGHDVRSPSSAPLTTAAPAAALSVTVPATVDEGSSLALSVTANVPAGSGSPVVSLRIIWGDGTVQSFATYTAGSTLTDSYSLPATATSDTVTVLATDAAGNAFKLPPAETEVVPTAPIDVNANVVWANEVDLSWVTKSQVAAGDEVLRADGGSTDYQDVADLPAGTAKYNDPTVEPGTAYAYKVVATNKVGGYKEFGSGSGGVPVTTPAQQLTLTAEAVAGSASTVELTWTYSGGVDIGLELEDEDLTAGTNFELVAQPAAVYPGAVPGPTYVTVTPGDQYRFRIRADLADGTVTEYATAALSLPEIGGPTLDASTDDDGGIDLTWGGGMDTSDGYLLQYRPSQTAAWTWEGYNHPDPTHLYDTSFHAVGDTPGLSYDFRVRADTTGSGWSNVSTATAGGENNYGYSYQQVAVDFTLTEVDATHYDIQSWSSGATDPASYAFAVIGDIGTTPPKRALWTDDWAPDYYRSTTFYGANATDVPITTDGQPFIVQMAVTGGTHTVPQGGYGYRVGGQPASVPKAPDLLSATVDPKNGNKIDLFWHNTPGDETGYEVLREIGDGPFVPIINTGPDVTDYSDPLLGTVSPGDPRQYEVVALGAGDSRSRGTYSDDLYQPYAPTYQLGNDSSDKGPDGDGRAQIDIGDDGNYYWHRLLVVLDSDGGVIIQHITFAITYNDPAVEQPYYLSYWECFSPNTKTRIADDWWSGFDNPRTLTEKETGDAIYYPTGSCPLGWSTTAILQSGGYAASYINPHLPPVQPLHQELTWTPGPSISVS